MNNTRRTFLMTLAAGNAAHKSAAYGQTGLADKDFQALALGRVSARKG